MKRIFVHLLYGLVVAISACNVQSQKDLPPPNILWIVSEDNSPFIGAFGDDFATTPVLDSLASVSVVYENAFAAAPVCAPTRSSIITGMYASSMGTENMRSNYPVPEMIKFFPKYLREAGYYCTNNAKKDYNTVDQPDAWDESSREATYRNRKPGQPFFHVQNFGVSHESSVHNFIPYDELKHDPDKVPIPPYHPQTPEMKHDWAQYYDKMQNLDSQIGDLIDQLKEDGLADSTIIFYYSDHGGVLGRSKRFIYESGLNIPLIVHFPEMYKKLSPGEKGSVTDRLVSFVDFAPTVLSLAGIEPPEYMQGKAFLGNYNKSPRDYTYSFRARMDERFDLTRSVRDKKYRYRRNYMPHKIYGQYIEYLWRAPSMRSWEEAYKAGELNEAQSRFWQPKPAEELYDVKADPHNVNNLAGNPEYEKVLKEMRQENQDWLKRIVDVGFIPEPIMLRISTQGEKSLYEYVRSESYPFDRILETAEMATMRDPEYVDEVISRLDDDNPVVRYWAATGCIILNEEASKARQKLMDLANDPEETVQIAAAEALYAMNEKDVALKMLTDALDSENLMARVQALNVLEIMGDDAKPALDKVKQLVPESPDSRGYDIRAARRIIEKFEDTL